MAASAPGLSASTDVAGSPRLGALWAIGAAGALAAVGSVGLALTSDHVVRPVLQAVLINWITLPFIVSGLIAWRRRPENRFGKLMVLAGFAGGLSTLQWSNAAWFVAIGNVVDLMPPALFLHVFLAFPTGRLVGRPERLLVVAAYLVAVVLQVVKLVLGVNPGGPLELFAQAEAAARVETVQLLTISVLLVAGMILLGVRRRGVTWSTRRPLALLVDAFSLGLLMLALLFVAGVFAWPVLETIRHVTFAVLGLAPIVFLLGLLDARLARSDIGAVLVQLRAEPAPDLRTVLARALHDPSLTLAYWLPQFDSWVDGAGLPIAPPQRSPGRATRVVYVSGTPVAALLFDSSLEDEHELLDAVTAATGIAMENGRLQAELRARLQELEGSRQRVLEAEQRERQRLERNLHDGAQQRLVALSLELGLLGDSPATGSTVRTRLAEARRELATSLEELRDVARGIHPAVLSGHGLEVALESLAARSPVPLRMSVEVDGRLPEQVEVAAYYVVCESLTNVGKHAHALSAGVRVATSAGQVVVEVVDDGVGGADTERGSGLRGLADRVEAIGGQLRIWTPEGGGTRVRAEIPCR